MSVKRAAKKSSVRAMLPRTATVKRSITLERSVDEAAHRLVGDRGFSELVNDAVKRAVQRRLIEDDVAKYEAEHGTIPAEIRDRARAKVAKQIG